MIQKVDKNITGFIELLHTYWENVVIALPILFGLTLFLSLQIPQNILKVLFSFFYSINPLANQLNKESWPIIYGILIYLFFCLMVYLFWRLTTKIERRKKGYISIVIGITCESNDIKNRIKNDFINKFYQCIKNSSMHKFQIIELSDFHSQQVKKKTLYYHEKIGAHFILYGNASNRMVNDENQYYLTLEASVAHSQIPEDLSNIFSLDMANILPREQIIKMNDEIKGFKISSTNTAYSVKYILGIASILSNDLNTAYNLHLSLYHELPSKEETKNSTTEKIKTATRLILIQETYSYARYFYQIKHDYLKMKEYLDELELLNNTDYSFHLLKSIYYFLHERDIEKAKKEIEQAHNTSDATWLYSKAFLFAYEGNLDDAYSNYKKAFRGVSEQNIPLDVEIFIVDVLYIEPKQFQLYYCLALINYFYKKDFVLAIKYFNTFIEEATKLKLFPDQINYSQNYLKKIQD